MRREGGKALFDALLIPDIGVDVMKDRKLRAVEGRNMEPCLSHQGKEPDRFQRYRLSAGIRSGDDQHIEIEIPADMNIGGHDLFFVQKRMSGLSKTDPPLFIIERLRRVLLQSKKAFGKDEIQLDQGPAVYSQLVEVLRTVAAECGKNRFDLRLFR